MYFQASLLWQFGKDDALRTILFAVVMSFRHVPLFTT